MKKVFLTLSAVVALSIGVSSCGSKDKKADAPVEATATVPAGADNVASDIASDVPSFSDEAVTKFCKDYKAALDETLDAYKSKDSKKIQEIQAKFTKISQEAGGLGGKIKQDEMQKYSDFMTKISTEYSKAVQAAATSK
jgi:predicted small lipoprotein YifL